MLVQFPFVDLIFELWTFSEFQQTRLLCHFMIFVVVFVLVLHLPVFLVKELHHPGCSFPDPTVGSAPRQCAEACSALALDERSSMPCCWSRDLDDQADPRTSEEPNVRDRVA